MRCVVLVNNYLNYRILHTKYCEERLAVSNVEDSTHVQMTL
jgi:hypothetical protein